jgi:L-ascorbate metabolism protein UlaG (beta-lactamase superfamily)
MEITWLGHSCFRLKGKETIIVTDPFDPSSVGLSLSEQKADVMTMSHQHGDHNYQLAVKAAGMRELFVIDGPGEYEICGVEVIGWPTFHDNQQGVERGKNVVYRYVLDEIRLVHLGDLGHMLDDQLLSDLGEVDVLLIPVGGVYTINHQQAAKVVAAIEPKMVVPMHYKITGMNMEVFGELAGVDDFLHEMGGSDLKPVDKLSVKSANLLSEEIEVVVLERKG